MAIYRNVSRSLILVIGVSCAIIARASASPTSDTPLVNETTGSGSELATSLEIDDDSPFLGLYNMFGGGNPRVTPTGQKLIEGDIVQLAPAPAAATTTRGDGGGSTSLLKGIIEGRKAVPDSSLYWPNGEVIYTYHESITQSEMAVIEAAMRHWSAHTCISFRPRQAGDLAFIRFRSDTQGCWSLVGRQVNSPNGFGQGQDVSIGAGCANLNVVVHEIGHVIGFFHEQSRSDRDQFIDIVWSNVLPGYALQFRKEADTNFNIPYDLTSTMQYPQWAFSKEIFEKSTIVARNPAYQRFLSKNYPLSFRDRLIANQMYSCTSACAGDSCQNGGYLRAIAGSGGGSSRGSGGGGGGGGGFGASSNGCTCDCPPNFAGAQCETQLRSDYYEELPCGGVVNEPGTIETPGYPQRVAPRASCMWDIQAPAGHQVSIKFKGFEFAPRFTKPGTKVINKCFNETVEIRLRNSNIYDGDTFCGTDIAPGTVMRSDGPRAVIIITANDKMLGSGLSARVRFLRDGQQDDEDEEKDELGDSNRPTKQTTSRPPPPTGTEIDRPGASTQRPMIFTTPAYTIAPPPIVQTLPPIMPPQPPRPPGVVTTSSLLEEYEKESKKTFPPVGPFALASR